MIAHSNAWTTSSNKKKCFGYIECWINKEGIVNIFSTPKLEEMGSCVTYDILEGYYIVHTKYGGVQLNKDEMGLPYIDAKKQYAALVQTVHNKF